MANDIQMIIKRNGERVPFDAARIEQAIYKAFLSENMADLPVVAELAAEVIETVGSRIEGADTNVEFVQDVVEEILMVRGFHKIAKKYILYREQHKLQRQQAVQSKIKAHQLTVILADQTVGIFEPEAIESRLRRLAEGLPKVSVVEMVESVSSQVYDRIPEREIELLILGAARERIERHYDYGYLASRIAIDGVTQRVVGAGMNTDGLDAAYRSQFEAYIRRGIELELLHPDLATFDCQRVAAALVPSRDQLFMYQGIQILLDRYLLQDRSMDRQVFELPQWFWMRVAMGLSLKEADREAKAMAFYDVLSNMDLVSSTPTLFNSGTCHSQMSSCYLNTVADDLGGIFKIYADNAHLSKWAGGIGTDWSRVRGTGSKIKGTNGASQGIIPFIKIFNDVALAVNQGGKRKGAMCAYLELWHMDVEQFIELKKNTGDERRRAHDINTAAWIPDLFMKRVLADGEWTLFCPADVPDLHDLYGQAFERRYQAYEADASIRSKVIKAGDLWRKMLTMLYETGHPWITFKDAANVRNPQSHVGVIHSSNLCTEITLNTSDDETAVCNLASLNLATMIANGQLDADKMQRTIRLGIRMLDNVIDNNFYPTVEAKAANMKHRAVGLGMMGYQDALYQLNIAFDSEVALEFADTSMEMVAYYAIDASSELAVERGSYDTFAGSKWSQGVFPFDTLDVLAAERGVPVEVDRQSRLDWDGLKRRVAVQGMRNSNTMAIAPTATIANIAGVYPCTEPAYKNIYMKENLSGNFIVINRYLMDDLSALGLWTPAMLEKIKLHNGSVRDILDIPQSIRDKYKETFEIASHWIIDAAARRSKWIDQSASTNVFMSTTSGRALSDNYMRAWSMGLKTTYYLRTLGASQVTKATAGVDMAFSPTTPESVVTVSPVRVVPSGTPVAVVHDVDCEACQ